MTTRYIPTVELLYLCDDDFRHKIDILREKFNLNGLVESEINLENVFRIDFELINNEQIANEYINDVKRIAKAYSLEGSETDLEIFIESGSAPYSSGIFQSHPGCQKFCNLKVLPASIKNGGGVIPGSSLYVKFKIRKPIILSELKEWVDSNAGEIVSMVNDHFKTARPAITKLDKLDRLLKIIKLKDEKKLTYAKIVNELCNENPNDPDVISGKVNEQSVKMLYNRYRKKKKSNIK